MKHRSFAVVAILAGLIVSCGGGGNSGDDDDDAKVDAPKKHDAPDQEHDAPGSGSSEASDLGKSCDGTGAGSADPTKCDATDDVCVTTNHTDFFCTKSCGEGAPGTGSAQPTPPAGGDAICEAQQPNSGNAQPRCALDGPTGSDGMVPWSCGLLCGSGATCPTGLTCTSNFCQ